jgi:hypothetical protein
MDSGTIIITAIFLAIIIVPFIITGYNRRNKMKKMLQSLKKLADEQNCYVTQSEVCSNFAIGIDAMANFLFFMKQTEEGVITKTVNLREYRNCRLNNSARNLSSKKEHYHVITKLILSFNPFDKSKSDEVIEIYNNEVDSLTLSGELQVAERWQEMIGLKLKRIQTSEPVRVRSTPTVTDEPSRYRKPSKTPCHIPEGGVGN